MSSVGKPLRNLKFDDAIDAASRSANEISAPNGTPALLAHPIAAVDLGSNSFHMVVAEADDGSIRVIDRLREMVRLATGLDASNTLSEDAVVGAYACLERFGERLKGIPRRNVRIVGTNALRKARNSGEFVLRAEALLGHPIDIISGYEEARLIFQGVAHGLDDDADTRLVIDIGGGSTEFILGSRFEPVFMGKPAYGCVSISERFFADGSITAAQLDDAVIAARQELEGIEANYRQRGWDLAVGASGSILAVRKVVTNLGFSRDGISRESLVQLRDKAIELGAIENLNLDGLSSERRPVFIGGLAILIAAFDALGIEHLRVSDRALREGLLLDLVGRISDRDIRETTVKRLSRQYNIDAEHATRVVTLLDSMLEQVAAPWELDADLVRVLKWAAELHELGLSVSHSQYQKHGAYLLENLDMPGFGRRDQTRLATLVRYHRRKFFCHGVRCVSARVAAKARQSGCTASPVRQFKPTARGDRAFEVSIEGGRDVAEVKVRKRLS